MKITLAQLAPRLGDVPANCELIEEWAHRAADDGSTTVLFPELALTGYRLRDLVPGVAVRLDRAGPVRDRLAELSRRIDLVLGMVEEGPDHRFFNSAAYFAGGQLRHVHRKCYLPTYGMFDEAMDFARGERLSTFDTPVGRAGLLICEDAWHPAAATVLAQDGALMLWTIAASPLRGTGPGGPTISIESVRKLAEVLARFHTAPFLFVNRVGFEEGLGFAGGSFAYSATGELLADAPLLEPVALTVEIDPDQVRAARSATPLVRDERPWLISRELARVVRRRSEDEG